MAGRDGTEAWTPERVGGAVVEAFCALPGLPVYAPRRGGLAAVVPGQDIGPLEILALSETVLGHRSRERRALLVWGRARATGGAVGGSISNHCREMGMHRRTFDAARKRACQRIAAALSDATSLAGASAGSWPAPHTYPCSTKRAL